MKKMCSGLFALLFLSAAVSVFAYNPPVGSQPFLTGFGSVEASRGYTGISELGSLDGLFYNPASMADARRIENSFSIGGFGTAGLYTGLGLALPTDIGVVSFYGLYTGSSASSVLNSLFGLKAGWSKPITENLFFGATVNAFSANMVPNGDWGLSLDLGLIYREENSTRGVGFLSPSYGFVLKNLGKPAFLTNYDAFPGIGFGVGASFNPIQLDFYRLRLFGDLSMGVYPFNLVMGLGMDNILFDLVHLSMGYSLSLSNLGIPQTGPLYAGIGVTGRFKINPTNRSLTNIEWKTAGGRSDNSTELRLYYAIQNQQYYGREEFSHTVTLSAAWGYYDDQAPEAAVTPTHAAFSPNFDGSQDTLPLKLAIRDNTRVEGWEVEVLDASGKRVQTFKSIPPLEVRTLTPEKVLKRLFSAKQQVEIPQQVVWDGQDESGKRVSDGEYSYVLRTWDENRNTNVTTAGRILLDTVIPSVKATNNYVIFSPNNDGAREELTLSLSPENLKAGDVFSAVILDSASNQVRTYRFDSAVPASIAWDGKDNAGKPVAEGVYTFASETSDAAGNRTVQRISDIELTTNYQKLELASSAMAFSPGSQETTNSAQFNLKVSDTRGLNSWVLSVAAPDGREAKRFTGSNTLPDSLVWDGRADNGQILPDGLYTYTLALEYESGNHPKTEPQTVKLDRTPPQVGITPQYLSFSPNGDGRQDTLSFAQTLSGEAGDELEIVISDPVGNPVFYGKYNSSEFPTNFTWNGLDRDLRPLPEGKYTYTVKGLDAVGNRSTVAVRDIFLKTGLEKVAVQSDVPAVAPGKSGAVTAVKFNITGSKDNVQKFVLEIKNASGTVVKSIQTNVFPDVLEWDGLDDGRRALPDGDYTYGIKVKYSFGDEPVSSYKPIRIDTVAPTLKAEPETLVFSPNGDGNKESWTVKQTVTADAADRFEGVIFDDAGKTVRTFRYTGNPPAVFSWDGRDDSGKPAPEGTYAYRLTGTDSAKNQVMYQSPSIRLVRTFEKLALSTPYKAFSPGGNGPTNVLTFSGVLSSLNGLEESRLTVYDGGGRVVRTVKYTNFPGTISWDGKLDNGQPAPDGNYLAEVLASFDSGNQITATVPGVTLDRTPPAPAWTISPEVFTPDGDGDSDTLFMKLALPDMSGLRSWSIAVSKKQEDGSRGPLFKKFSGAGAIPELIEWDGMSDDKQDGVESVQDYFADLEAYDTLGNRTNMTREITVGVLVEKTPDGLRIRVSSIRFATSRADLIGDSKKNLDKVILILRKILSDPKKYGITENYRIEISGHTDDVPGPTADYNQKLSERRARSVYDYLVEKDVNPAVLTSVGYGESRPYKQITAGMTKEKRDDYRSRNRRVEFFIRR